MGTSYQKGWVRLRGKKWYGYFRRMEIDPSTSEPKPAVAQVILGFKSEMSKSQAREKLESEIAKLGKQPLNGDKSMVNGAVTFGWFVLHRYLPLKEADWRDETAKVKKHLIQADLVDEFGDVRLETSTSSRSDSPQQAGQDAVERQSLANSGIHQGDLR